MMPFCKDLPNMKAFFLMEYRHRPLYRVLCTRKVLGCICQREMIENVTRLVRENEKTGIAATELMYKTIRHSQSILPPM